MKTLKVLIVFIILILSGCKPNTRDFCLIYNPVMGYGPVKDLSLDVYYQIRRNNLKYSEMCI